MFEKLFDLGIKLFLVFFPVTPAETGKIAENLYAVKTGTVDFFVYRSGEDVVCFDAGFGRHLILNGLKEIGVAPEEITHLFLTHTDLDHVGGVKLFPNAKIYLSKDEEPMIKGRKTRKLFIRNPRLKRPYHLLEDNETVTVGDLKVQVLFTPGHTPGSVCYLVNDGLLFAGDTIKLIDGKVRARGGRIRALLPGAWRRSHLIEVAQHRQDEGVAVV